MEHPTYGIDVLALTLAVVLAAAIVLIGSHLMHELADVPPASQQAFPLSCQPLPHPNDLHRRPLAAQGRGDTQPPPWRSTQTILKDAAEAFSMLRLGHVALLTLHTRLWVER
jgi:hypothetical protein